MSIEHTDREAGANAVAPRVALKDIEAAIAARFDVFGDEAMAVAKGNYQPHIEVPVVIEQLALLSLCVLVMTNGFVVVGTSAPASPENFNEELGRKLAYENAIRQLWPLMGFALKDRLAKDKLANGA